MIESVYIVVREGIIRLISDDGVCVRVEEGE